jgi:predicted NUDIX family phosphoesterase
VAAVWSSKLTAGSPGGRSSTEDRGNPETKARPDVSATVPQPSALPHAERVLVVPAAELDRLGRFQGFSHEADKYLGALLVPGLARFGPRSEVEDDPTLKQIIPYVVFRSEGSVFCYTRGGGGEARLRRRRSLGVGGHVAEADAEGRGTVEAYEMALRRELDEEVEVASPGAMRRVGLINDDATPVGRVHLGVVHVYDLERPDVRPREADLAEPGFVPVGQLRDDWDAFETWSQICIDGFLTR